MNSQNDAGSDHEHHRAHVHARPDFMAKMDREEWVVGNREDCETIAPEHFALLVGLECPERERCAASEAQQHVVAIW